MAVTHKLYGNSMKNILNGNFNNLGSTASVIKVALMTSAHTYSAANEVFADVSTNQTSTATYGDYTAGGITATGKSLAYADRVTTLKSTDDVIFCSTGTITAYHAVVYEDLSTNKYLLSSIDFDGVQSAVSGEFKVAWTDDKILTVTVAS